MIWSQKLCAWVPRPAWMSAQTYARLPHIIAVAGACIGAPLIGYHTLPLAPLDHGAAHAIKQHRRSGGDPAFIAPPSRNQGYSYAPPVAFAPSEPIEPIPVPEPSSAAILLTAVIALAAAKRRKALGETP